MAHGTGSADFARQESARRQADRGRAGNRAVAQVLARRVVGNDAATRVVKLEVGFELTEKLARAAWTLTAKGPLDEAGVESLRQIALEQYFDTIDDDERLFIAALLDAGNASKLHEQYPRGFSDNGSVIEFNAASITETNRRIVRDSGRSVRLQPTESDKAFIKDTLDQDIVAMTGPFRIVAMQTLKLADKAGIDHVKVYFAMLNGASDSTPEHLKIDEVSSTWFDAEGEGSHAEFVPESSGQRKGDTIYVPATFAIISDVNDRARRLPRAWPLRPSCGPSPRRPRIRPRCPTCC